MKTTIAIVIASSVLVQAQVAPIYRSNALDASPQIGSGGYNSAVRNYGYSYGGYGNYGNLYITNNVTGGKGFRGFVPYSDPTQFRGSLGSGFLTPFDSGTINLRRVQEGHTGGMTLPYYNSSSTILPLSAQRQGYNIPGSSVPRSQVLPQPESYGLRAVLPRPTTEVPPLPPNVRTTDILVPSMITPPQEIQTKIDYLTPYEQRNPQPSPSPSPTEQLEQKVQQPQPIIAQPTPEPQPSGQGQEPGQDYSTWLKLQAEKAEKPQATYQPLNPEYSESAKQMAVQGKLAKPPAESPAKKQPSHLQLPVVTDLAGKGKDPFSRTMRTAQESLIHGNFYDAYQRFGQAQSIKPEDPLAVYGKAHALLAAGDLRSAADQLQLAIGKFPRFLRLKLDGNRLLGSKAVFNRRSEQLSNLRDKNPDNPQLMLLAGYVKILSGQAEAGLKLITDSKLVPADKF